MIGTISGSSTVSAAISYSRVKIRAYKIHRPYLELSLSSGGDLDADTEYFFTGICTNSIGRIRSGYSFSAFADVESITTTPTNKTINLTWYVKSSIDSIVDWQNGQVKVYSPWHSMGNGQQIEITGTTNYNGSYTILHDHSQDGEDYFRIEATFAGTESGEWRVNGNNVVIGKTYGLLFWMGIYDPYNPTTGKFDCDLNNDKLSRWNLSPDFNKGVTSGRQITSLMALTVYNNLEDIHPEATKGDTDLIPAGFDQLIGRPHVAIQDIVLPGEFTEYLISNEVFAKFCDYSSSNIGGGINSTMEVNALFDLSYQFDGRIYLQDYQLILYGGITGNSWSAFYNCRLSFLLGYRPWFKAFAIVDSYVTYTLGGDSFELAGIEIIEDVTLEGDNFYTSGVEEQSFKNIILKRGGDTEEGQLLFAYPDATKGSCFENVTIYDGFPLYLYHPIIAASGDTLETAYLKNITFDALAYSGYDILLYDFGNSPNTNHHYYFYNVTTPRGKVAIARSLDMTFCDFHYSVKSTIVDVSSNPIEDADVVIVDKNNLIYNATTDENGEFELNVLGYINEPLQGGNEDNVSKGPFRMVIRKAGFQNVSYYFDEIEQPIDLVKTAMFPEPATIYNPPSSALVTQYIDLIIEEELITAKV